MYSIAQQSIKMKSIGLDNFLNDKNATNTAMFICGSCVPRRNPTLSQSATMSKGQLALGTCRYDGSPKQREPEPWLTGTCMYMYSNKHPGFLVSHVLWINVWYTELYTPTKTLEFFSTQFKFFHTKWKKIWKRRCEAVW